MPARVPQVATPRKLGACFRGTCGASCQKQRAGPLRQPAASPGLHTGPVPPAPPVPQVVSLWLPRSRSAGAVRGDLCDSDRRRDLGARSPFGASFPRAAACFISPRQPRGGWSCSFSLQLLISSCNPISRGIYITRGWGAPAHHSSSEPVINSTDTTSLLWHGLITALGLQSGFAEEGAHRCRNLEEAPQDRPPAMAPAEGLGARWAARALGYLSQEHRAWLGHVMNSAPMTTRRNSS